MLFNAAVTNQTQPESSPSLMGSTAGGRLPATPLTPNQATRPAMELGVVGESSEVTDRFREGPCDIHQDSSHSVPSQRLLQDNQVYPFRLLEYVGAPESARLTSRSPEYWVHHMGRENALSATLQLQHDAGLMISNFRSYSSW